MSREIDFDKPLSDDDRQYAVQRGLLTEVDENDNRFRQGPLSTSSENPVDTGRTYAVHNGTGLNGNEPSGTADRTTVSGLGAAQAELNVTPPVPSAETETATDASDSEEESAGGTGGKYEEWTTEELREELASRELSKSGNKAELVARLTADDADKESE